jgi:hypothetical protein
MVLRFCRPLSTNLRIMTTDFYLRIHGFYGFTDYDDNFSIYEFANLTNLRIMTTDFYLRIHGFYGFTDYDDCFVNVFVVVIIRKSVKSVNP